MRNALALFPLALPLAVTLTPACGGADLGSCPPASEAQQAQGKQVMDANCTVCHSSQVSGTLRFDAPTDLDFDDPATVSAEAESMYAETESGSMPPDGRAKVTGAELEALRVYLACASGS